MWLMLLLLESHCKWPSRLGQPESLFDCWGTLSSDQICHDTCSRGNRRENEYPRAYVTLKEEVRAHVNAAQIYDWVKTRLSRHKWLDGGIVFVDEVPRLASGKIQRKILREWTKRDALAIEASGRKGTAMSKL
jgi:acyl-CoA synthetase (AMP-forming)/AMP-acid ligase II